jgi:hypothetical protein
MFDAIFVVIAANNIGSKGAASIANMLKANKTLKELSLNGSTAPFSAKFLF